ncbi:MAG: PP2C family protein-serine/threonine phosphatase [Solirubrobacteraceae bacterium]|nr:PP2C family protein-serine/threonine phosphatase [Solirubrobacteraceae bacterium]
MGSTNGRVAGHGQQDSAASAPSSSVDEQTLSDSEQTLGDRDQTLSEADQTTADDDQTSADSDQLAADRDQAASDSDRDRGRGVDPRVYAQSHDVREHTTRQRERSARERDAGARVRLEVADRRDAAADDRDAAAQRRDEEAAARNLEMAALDSEIEDADAHGPPGAAAIIRARGRRRRAALRRAQAAAYRELAAEDRRAAARDRALAAQERLEALEDREALAGELLRERERRDAAQRHQRRAQTLARTLQRCLSPPGLPRIAGLDVALHYEPFAAEEVGGDFYDLFPLAPGRTGFFLGDVCGKGPEAANVASLARYTMRTAAMLRESPAAILSDLNVALHMDTGEPRQTCTVVYGQIDTSGAEVGIHLAVAGHPSPLIVRAGGGVETTTAHGTILGAVDEPAFHTCEVHLAPGDALVIYSDGILDAAIDGTPIDEQRVGALLAGPAGASAADLVGRLTDTLRRIDAPLRDDVALMALLRSPPA